MCRQGWEPEKILNMIILYAEGKAQSVVENSLFKIFLSCLEKEVYFLYFGTSRLVAKLNTKAAN